MPRELADWGPSPEQRFAQTEMHEILSEVNRQTRAGFPRCFRAARRRRASTEETAKVLGISVPAVKSRLLRARLKLRDKLNRYFRQVAQIELQRRNSRDFRLHRRRSRTLGKAGTRAPSRALWRLQDGGRPNQADVDVFCDSKPVELPGDVKSRLHDALRRKLHEKKHLGCSLSLSAITSIVANPCQTFLSRHHIDLHRHGEIPGRNPIRLEECDFRIAGPSVGFPRDNFGKFLDASPANFIAMKKR